MEKRRIKVSRSKTEYVCINGKNDKETVKIEDTKVSRLKRFKYGTRKWQLSEGGKEESGDRMEPMEKSIRNNL